jgi:uncharacterized protein (TIGR00369 family)
MRESKSVIETQTQSSASAATARPEGRHSMHQPDIETRSRRYTWTDPLVNAAELGRRSGLEILRAIGTGELPTPPIMHTLDFTGLEIEEGRVVFTMKAQEFHYNPLGTVHGGVLATLLDTAAGCAVHTTLPVGVGYTSLDLATKFLRPVTVDSGQLRCEGTVLNRGRRTALSEARLYDEAGRMVAHATSTCMIFEITGPWTP